MAATPDARPAPTHRASGASGRCRHCYNDTHVDARGALVGPTGETRCINFDDGGAFLSYAGMTHLPLPSAR